MKHLAHFEVAQSPSTALFRTKTAGIVLALKSLATLSIGLTMLFCCSFLLAATLVRTDSICFLTVLKHWDSGYAQEQNLVINSKAEWQSVWEQIYSNTSEKPPLPEVDFSRRTILACFQGRQPSNGYEISIEEITETKSGIEVRVKAFAPGEHCVLLGATTRPLDIVEIEKTEKEVVFRVKHKIRDCG